jgi:hypothetical protein
MSGPMSRSEPIPHGAPSTHSTGPIPHGHTHAIRLHFAGGWDTYATYPSREEAMEAYGEMRANGEPSANIIVCRV